MVKKIALFNYKGGVSKTITTFKTVMKKLKPVLEKNNLLLPNQVYSNEGMNGSFTMTKISDFNSLIAQGIVAEINEKKQEEFKTIFSDLANKIISLSLSYAVSP